MEKLNEDYYTSMLFIILNYITVILLCHYLAIGKYGNSLGKIKSNFYYNSSHFIYIFSLASKALLLSLKGDKGMKASESYLVNKFIISLIMSSI